MNSVSCCEVLKVVRRYFNPLNFSHQFVVASFFVIVAVASAAPQGQERPIAIINQSSNQEADGSYQYK